MPTSDNPTDCASRGIFSDELINHAIWWHGPPWLRFSKDDWPPEPDPHPVDTPSEEKVVALHSSEPLTCWDLASRYSEWPRLIRVIAYIFKFVNACRHINVDGQPHPSHSKAYLPPSAGRREHSGFNKYKRSSLVTTFVCCLVVRMSSPEVQSPPSARFSIVTGCVWEGFCAALLFHIVLDILFYSHCIR